MVFGLFILFALISAFIVVLSYKYSGYVMMVFLALVAVAAAFAFFDTEVPKIIASLAFFILLVAPFFVAYSRIAAQLDTARMQGFAMVSILVIVFFAFLINELLVNSPLVELLRLAKKFMKKRGLRSVLSVLSVIVFAAGVTSLALLLPPTMLIVPFVIVVCELALSTLGNVYERKGEIFALATTGLNPDRLMGLFQVEAVIIGFLGGGLGYASGLGLSILVALPFEKVELSTGWITTVLLISLAAAVTASIQPSLKASMIATPSLERRWWRRSFPVGWPPVWTVKIPVKVRKDNILSFFNHFLSYAEWLEKLPSGSIERAEGIRIVKSEPVDGEDRWYLSFTYIFGWDPPTIVTENELRASRDFRSEEYAVDLTVKVIDHHNVDVYQALRHIVSAHRQMAFEWTEIR